MVGVPTNGIKNLPHNILPFNSSLMLESSLSSVLLPQLCNLLDVNLECLSDDGVAPLLQDGLGGLFLQTHLLALVMPSLETLLEMSLDAHLDSPCEGRSCEFGLSVLLCLDFLHHGLQFWCDLLAFILERSDGLLLLGLVLLVLAKLPQVKRWLELIVS